VLNRLFGRASEPRLDPALGNAHVQRLRALLAAGEWGQADDALEPLRDWDLRDLAVAAASEQAGRPGWIEAWTTQRPRSASGWLVRGAHTVQWAWQARGGRTADQTQEAAFAVFHDRLYQGEGELRRAAELAPDDPTPHVWRLVAGRGLELALAELRARFDAAVRLQPEHRFAHNHFLQASCRKWGGSDELMFGFAREAATRAPVDSCLHTLIAEAHIERWLGVGMFREGDQRSYFAQPAVQAEVQQAADCYLRSPQLRATPRTPWDRNIFAFCFWLMGDMKSAREQFTALDGLTTQHPWQYLGGPLAVYAKARQSAGVR
jgi:hypothetical protein